MEGLCTIRHREFSFCVSEGSPADHAVWDGLRVCFRLISHDVPLRIARPSYWCFFPVVNIYRFEEKINGREYRIEVSAVSTGQWRAQLVRVPGGSCALMPFYGATPEDAARHLTEWLGRAHRAAIRAS